MRRAGFHQIDAFQRDGHAVVRGLATADELAEVGPIIERLGVEHAYDKRPLEERDTYGKAFLQSFNLWRVDDRIARFVLSKRFAGVAAALTDVLAPQGLTPAMMKATGRYVEDVY